MDSLFYYLEPMLYEFGKKLAQLSIKIYCRNIKINNKEFFESKEPLLLAANHPNSFFDAIILCTLFDRPVYSLARGDAFSKKLVAKLLRSIKMLPVYRASEGVDNLDANYKTFEECTAILKQNGIVLIFCEGQCVNEWHLRSLKKGTARLAITAWEQNIPVKVLPVGMNYSSFRLFGKNIKINFGRTIESKDLNNSLTDTGRLLNELTGTIHKQLQTLVYEIDTNDHQTKKEKFYVPVSNIKKTFLFLPAFAGLLSHWPFYVPVKSFITKKAGKTQHYDSIIIGLLMLGYPLFLLLWALIIYVIIGGYWGWSAFIFLPFFAWSYVQLKPQFEK